MLPVALLVTVLNFTPLISLTAREIVVFIISAVMLVIGMAFFNLGADIAMTPMGDHIGAGLTRSKKVEILIAVCFVMGVFITIAEPDLTVLATQVKDKIDPVLLTVTVGVGVGLFLVISVVRMIKGTPLSHILIFFYMCLFAFGSLLVIGNEEFLALAFDSGGVTTGPITVPFIMALGVGIAGTLGGKKSSENSFGLVALCSIGPMLAVMILGIFSKGDMVYEIPDYSIAADFGGALLSALLTVSKEVGIAIGLIVGFFIALDLIFLKLPLKKLKIIGGGVIYTFIGLLIFLTAAQIGFMPIGYKIGCELAAGDNFVLVIVGFVLGALVVMAEPAVHVLTKQVDEITSGGITKRSMLIALCLGVGIHRSFDAEDCSRIQYFILSRAGLSRFDRACVLRSRHLHGYRVRLRRRRERTVDFEFHSSAGNRRVLHVVRGVESFNRRVRDSSHGCDDSAYHDSTSRFQSRDTKEDQKEHCDETYSELRRRIHY